MSVTVYYYSLHNGSQNSLRTMDNIYGSLKKKQLRPPINISPKRSVTGKNVFFLALMTKGNFSNLAYTHLFASCDDTWYTVTKTGHLFQFGLIVLQWDFLWPSSFLSSGLLLD